MDSESASAKELCILIAYVLALLLILCAAFSILYHTFKTHCPPIPSSLVIARSISQALKQRAPATVYELGSGFGFLLFYLAKQAPQHAYIGVEISPIPYCVCVCVKKFARFKNVALIRSDFLKTDLKGAEFLVCYLAAPAMRLLKIKLIQEAKPELYVFSNFFEFRGATPDKVERFENNPSQKLYLYRCI